MNQTVDENVGEPDESNMESEPSSAANFHNCGCLKSTYTCTIGRLISLLSSCWRATKRSCCSIHKSDGSFDEEEEGETNGSDEQEDEEDEDENIENFSHAFSMTSQIKKSSSSKSSLNMSKVKKPKMRNRSGSSEFLKHLKEFNAELAKYSMVIRDVQRDGNCLFRSISDQLEGFESEHMHYRTLAVTELKKNKEFYKNFIFDQEFDAYVSEMAENYTWGGNLEIQALSHALGHNFIIHMKGMPHLVIKGKPVLGIAKRTLHLAFHSENEGEEHYSSIRNISDDRGTPAESIQHDKFRQLEREMNKYDQEVESTADQSIVSELDDEEEEIMTQEVPDDPSVVQAIHHDSERKQSEVVAKESDREDAKHCEKTVLKEVDDNFIPSQSQINEQQKKQNLIQESSTGTVKANRVKKQQKCKQCGYLKLSLECCKQRTDKSITVSGYQQPIKREAIFI